MQHAITYKVKLRDFQDLSTLEFKKGFIPKKNLYKIDCTMRPQDHRYYNSDMFLGMLARQHDALTKNGRVQYIDKLPAHITIKDCGFLHEITIQLPETFK